jgi:hypothetical protein
MTDLHLRILRIVAERRQRELDDDDDGQAGDHSSAGRRRDLERAAWRSKAIVAAAQARRGYAWPGPAE